MSDVMDHVLDGVEEAEMHRATPAATAAGELRTLLRGAGGRAAVVVDDTFRYVWIHFLWTHGDVGLRRCCC